MSLGLRRVAGLVGLLGGVGVAAWLVFGSPHEWEGGMRWLRHGLAWACLGGIGLTARLIFPDARSRTSER